MGILFVYLGNWVNKVGPSKNFFKLILAYNKIERFSKIVNPAEFWAANDSHILAGQDPADHNGTWLGVSTMGKLGTTLKLKGALNQASSEDYQRRIAKNKGRSFTSRALLVPNFLRENCSSWDFCSKLCEGPETRCPLKRYFPFQLFLVDFTHKSTAGSIKATYLSNFTTPDINHREKPMDITPPIDSCDFFAYGNSPLYKPYNKVIAGRGEFIDLIMEHHCDNNGAVVATQENKLALRDDLLVFLRSTKRYIPDQVLLDYARASRIKEKVVYKLSKRFVPEFFDKGTRTQTVILVDTNNNVTYYEWQLKHPIYNPETSEWIETVHEFKAC